MATNCSFCGTEIKPGETVCSFCGTPVENMPESESKTTAAQDIVPVENAVTEKENRESSVEEVPAEEVISSETREKTLPEAEKKEPVSAVSEENPTGEKIEKTAPVENAVVEKKMQEKQIEEVSAEKVEKPVADVDEKHPVGNPVSPENGALRLITEQKTTYRCSGCGKMYGSEIRFCSDCGGKIEHVVEEIPTDRAVKTVVEQKNICSKCGKDFWEGIRFCFNCGGKIEQKEIVSEVEVSVRMTKKNCCSGCGKEYPDGIRFCSDCGGKIKEKQVLAETMSEGLVAERQKIIDTLSCHVEHLQQSSTTDVSVEISEDSGKTTDRKKKNVDYAEIFAKVTKLSSRFYVAPNIPKNKLLNAILTYAPEVNPQDVVALLDGTMWKSAKEGILVTPCAVYGKLQFTEPYLVPLSPEVKAEVKIDDDGSSVVCIGGTNLCLLWWARGNEQYLERNQAFAEAINCLIDAL